MRYHIPCRITYQSIDHRPYKMFILHSVFGAHLQWTAVNNGMILVIKWVFGIVYINSLRSCFIMRGSQPFRVLSVVLLHSYYSKNYPQMKHKAEIYTFKISISFDWCVSYCRSHYRMKGMRYPLKRVPNIIMESFYFSVFRALWTKQE